MTWNGLRAAYGCLELLGVETTMFSYERIVTIKKGYIEFNL